MSVLDYHDEGAGTLCALEFFQRFVFAITLCGDALTLLWFRIFLRFVSVRHYHYGGERTILCLRSFQSFVNIQDYHYGGARTLNLELLIPNPIYVANSSVLLFFYMS